MVKFYFITSNFESTLRIFKHKIFHIHWKKKKKKCAIVGRRNQEQMRLALCHSSDVTMYTLKPHSHATIFIPNWSLFLSLFSSFS